MHLLLIFLFCLFVDPIYKNTSVFFYDTFENFNNWKSFQFSSGKKPTDYDIINKDQKHYLQIKSDSSASGLICKTKFNPNHYPLLKWNWKVNNIIPNADSKIKAGDDYPLRIFVMFEKDSSEISFWDKIINSAVELVSGYEPPYKSLCYVWANSKSDSSNYFSPYTEDVMIIPKQSGADNCKQWIVEQVNIVRDYKKYFKEEIPPIACLALLGDTDNTISQTTSFIDYIEIK